MRICTASIVVRWQYGAEMLLTYGERKLHGGRRNQQRRSCSCTTDESAKYNDIVVAFVENEVTLKRYRPDAESGQIILHPENKRMKDIVVDECRIQGVAIKVIKDLGN